MPDLPAEQLPAYFLPEKTKRPVDDETLHRIAVAGKLVYAHVRWLDDLIDSPGVSEPPAQVHRLTEALGRLIRSTFSAAFKDSPACAAFFSSLADLHARYAGSVALDRGAPEPFTAPLSLEDYVEHAKARAAPMRAPLDALLLLIEAPEDQTETARSCFECCVAGLQLYDDALDVEEDFRDGRLSWVVAETLRSEDGPCILAGLGADRFYEAALVGGFINQNLTAAEGLFRQASALAQSDFPNCVRYFDYHLCCTRELRDDLQALVGSHR